VAGEAKVSDQSPREAAVVLWPHNPVAVVKTAVNTVVVALRCAAFGSGQRQMKAPQASPAMVAPCAVEQRGRDVHGEPRPGDSELDRVR
jgi:hypothetical protein